MREVEYLKWSINLQSDLDIIELWNIVSREILWWAKLWWLEKSIYDEVPAIFLWNLLWMSVILSWYKWLNKNIWYNLFFRTIFRTKNGNYTWILLDDYLHALCKEKLEPYGIKVLGLQEEN